MIHTVQKIHQIMQASTWHWIPQWSCATCHTITSAKAAPGQVVTHISATTLCYLQPYMLIPQTSSETWSFRDTFPLSLYFHLCLQDVFLDHHGTESFFRDTSNLIFHSSGTITIFGKHKNNIIKLTIKLMIMTIIICGILLSEALTFSRHLYYQCVSTIQAMCSARVEWAKVHYHDSRPCSATDILHPLVGMVIIAHKALAWSWSPLQCIICPHSHSLPVWVIFDTVCW